MNARLVERRNLTLSSTMQTGSSAPQSWQGGISWAADEPLGDVLAALDAALAQLRAQVEIDIRETLR